MEYKTSYGKDYTDALTEKLLDAEGLPDVTLLPDGTHPGPAGYTLWADELLPYLKEICGTPEQK